MEYVKYYNIDTLVDLSTIKFSASEDDTSYITYSNLTSQQGTPDIPWNSICSIASVGQIYTHGKFYFPGKSGYTGSVYGVQWNTADPSPECTRIGNMSLHATLPVQSQMVGGTMTDEGVFTEFSNQSDWTSETRDGSIGQVMVRIPRFWWKFETIGDFNRVLMSAIPVIGFKEVPMHYVSAYEASLQKSTNKLSSVVNSDPDYRGGNNKSAWDNEDTAGYNGESHRSLLGRPVTSVSLTDFRTYARNRNVQEDTDWNCMMYLTQKVLYWLYVTEYATLNSQKDYNAASSTEGYKQGGLGNGVANWTDSEWSRFNNHFPFIPCGWTDEFGNTTGVKDYVVKNASGSSLLTTSVPRYRGIENPFGHIWQWTDGVLVNVQSASSGGKSLIYTCYDPAKFSSSSTTDYEYIGDEYRSSTYFTKLTFGSNGDITADSASVTGSSTSYYCDRHYAAISSSDTSLRGLEFGGSSHQGSYAGFVDSASDDAPNKYYARIGSRLTYLPSDDTIISVAKFKSVVPNTATSIIFGKLEDYDVTEWTLLDYIGSRAQIAVFNQGTEYLVLNIKNKTIYAPSNCGSMFYNYTALSVCIFDNFNTQNVTSMLSMFENCNKLKSLDLSGFNTKNCSDMRSMFHHCNTLKTLDLSNFNTEKITSCYCMFRFCQSLLSLDLSSFNTAKVINMDNMFTQCNNLAQLNLSSFNTEKVTTFANFLNRNYKLASLDLSSFNTAACKYFDGMFERTNIKTIISNTFDITSKLSDSNMFYQSYSLVGGNGTTYNSSHTTAEYARIDGENDLPGYFTAPQVNS